MKDQTPKAEASDREICGVCQKEITGTAFCHFYQEGHRLVFCSPECAEAFLNPTPEMVGVGEDSNGPP